jgi:DNA-binding transcriptional MocR family regulator
MTIYAEIAEQIAGQIRAGVIRSGERLPSVRALARARRVSPMTVLQAFRLLESRGDVQARPRSGFYASAHAGAVLSAPTVSQPRKTSGYVDKNELIFEILASIKSRSVVGFGSAFIDPALFPLKKLSRYMANAARRLNPDTLVQNLPPGNPELRRAIARRYLQAGMTVDPEDVVITTGALEALHLCLKAATGPGDAVAIESPTFYGALQAIEMCRLKAVSIPTDPESGLDLGALSEAIEKRGVKACWMMTTFQNPLGSRMPEDKKRDLVRLLAQHEIPLIEDDVYQELYFGTDKPRPAKAFDRKGLVLHCSSLSKTLSPGYRVGWAIAGRFSRQVEREKWATTITTNMPAQAALGDYLKHGGYDHHLRGLRGSLQKGRDQMTQTAAQCFPAGCRMTHPAGGYFLWVEMPPGTDSLKVHARAMESGMSVAPGPIFATHDSFRNCIRLNYGMPWTPRVEKALSTLGAIIADAS